MSAPSGPPRPAPIVATFADQGISGAAVGNRPQFLAMMRASQRKEFDLLLVMDLSRLSRSQADLAKTLDRLTFAGIRVVAPQGGFDTEHDGHELVSGLIGIIGQQFRKMIAGKVRSALHSRALTQRAAGGRAFGYRPDQRPDGRKWFAVVDREAAVVRQIFERSADGESAGAIAAALNNQRVPSPGASWARTERRCQGWAGSAVRVILRNPRWNTLFERLVDLVELSSMSNTPEALDRA